MVDSYAHDHGLVCKNVNCPSYGTAHYNCKCYSSGGQVHCANGLPHLEGCEYFAQGGMPEDPSVGLGHAAAHHGLSGMMKSVGHSKLADPDKHIQTLDKAKRHMEDGNHDKANSSLSGHPMVGSMGKDLPDAMERLGPRVMEMEAHPGALKSSMDYLHSAHKGQTAMKAHMKGIFGDGPEAEPEEALRETLKGHLDEIEQNPEKLLDVAGNLGHYMPEHATQLAAMMSTATDYLKSIKPQPISMGPLEEPAPPNKVAQAAYDRQIDIAEQPLLVAQHVKDGTLLPQDVQTLQTIYPGLYRSMVDQAGEQIIEAKSKGKEIPYKRKLKLSMLMSQPLDATQDPMNMQAIIKSQGMQQASQQQKGPKKASDTELKQINKVDAMAATDLQDRQIDKKIDKV